MKRFTDGWTPTQAGSTPQKPPAPPVPPVDRNQTPTQAGTKPPKNN